MGVTVKKVFGKYIFSLYGVYTQDKIPKGRLQEVINDIKERESAKEIKIEMKRDKDNKSYAYIWVR